MFRAMAATLARAGLAALLLVGGCSSPRSAGDDDDTVPDTSCTDLPMSQQVSEPCCPDHGPDACGANLFCEAFDGRTQPTCYILRSRLDGEECRADDHCSSLSCNLEVEQCRALPLSPCDTAIGCSAEIDQQQYACVGGTCAPTDGRLGSPCGTSSDCGTGVCVREECAACSADGDCPSGSCLNGGCVECTQGGDCPSGVCNADHACCVANPDACTDGSEYDCRVDDGCGHTIECPCARGTCDDGGRCSTTGARCTPGVTDCGIQECLFDNLSKSYLCGTPGYGPSDCAVDSDCDQDGNTYNFNHCHFFGEFPACRPWCLTDEDCAWVDDRCLEDYPDADSITEDTPGYCG